MKGHNYGECKKCGKIHFHCKGMLNKKHSEETRHKISQIHKGKILSNETKQKMALSRKGKTRILTEEWKQNISNGLKGEKNPFYGKHHTEETKRKLREAQIGEKAHAWKGGTSRLPYTYDWWTVKYQIKKRDNWTCFICQIVFSPKERKFLKVHHIDYNKQNNNPKNLISLCGPCHGKTHYDRNKWINYFSILKEV